MPSIALLPANNSQVEALLVRNGFTVVPVNSADECCNARLSEVIAVLVGESHLEHVSLIRQQCPTLPIVAVAASDRPASIAGCLAAAVDDVVLPEMIDAGFRDDLRRIAAEQIQASTADGTLQNELDNTLGARWLRMRRALHAERAQRQQLELSIEQSEQLYHSLLDNIPLALFRKDDEGRVTFGNRRLLESFQRKPEEILGKTDFDLFPAELARKYRADDQWVRETRETFEATEEFVTPSGESRFTHVIKTPVFDAANRVVGTQGIFSDVTDQRRAELALEHERYLLESFVSNSLDYIDFQDCEGRFVRANQALADLCGVDQPSGLIGRTEFDFFPRDYAERSERCRRQILETGDPVIAREERIQKPGGTPNWLSITRIPLRDPAGATIGTFGIARNITASKEAETTLRHAAEVAQAASRAKSDFLANMSHEIRTPLNAILGLTELVLDSELTDLQREYLSTLMESGESLLTLVNDILDFSKIEAGQMKLDEVRFNLQSLIGDTVKSLALRAHRKGLELACHVDAAAPETIIADNQRLRQIVINLVVNAIKFTEQGEVLVDAKVRTNASGQAVLHLMVADTGIGIPEDKLQSIFAAFVQADTSTTRRYGGTGLGLAICTRLAQLMNGRIWAESRVGEGSTFHLEIPVLRDDVGEPHPSIACDALKGFTVYIADDHPRSREILSELVTVWGMNAAPFPSYRTLIERLDSLTPLELEHAILLVDAAMPASHFEELKSRYRVSRSGPFVIKMLSAGDREESTGRERDRRFDAHLMKPVQPSELLNILTEIATDTRGRRPAIHEGKLISARLVTKRPRQILLAEDSLVNQKLAVGLLNRFGHQVTVAENGAQAAGLVEQKRFDLILMDIQMPVMDGFEATRAIRELDPDIPIIAMTAHAMAGDRERCLDAGMDEYVVKPIRSQQLFDVIEATPTRNAPSAPSAQTSERVASTRSSETSGIFAMSTRAPAAGDSQVDWTALRRTVDGNEDILGDIIEAFCQEAPVMLASLEKLADGTDWSEFRRIAHSLKSSFRTFGATSLADRAEMLEHLAKQGLSVVNPPNLDPVQISVLKEGVEAMINELRAKYPTRA